MSKEQRKWFKQKKPFKNKKIKTLMLSSAGKIIAEAKEEFYYIMTSRGVRKYPNPDNY